MSTIVTRPAPLSPNSAEMTKVWPRGQNYFTRREPTAPIDYEAAYWGTVTDPDGNVRDRSKERDQFLADAAEEIGWLNALKPGRILDVGCGLGFLLSAIEGNWDRHGCEVSRYAAAQAAPWGRIHQGELRSAAYPTASFDVVVLHHVIEHMTDPIGEMREVMRVLKPGGSLLLGTPDFDSGCARRFGHNYRLLHDATHISLFSNESMHRFLRDMGLVIDRVEYPFFNTRHFTQENLERLFDTDHVSPPFYGNFMTFYCRKLQTNGSYDSLMALSRMATLMADTASHAIEAAGDALAEQLLTGHKVLVCGNGGSAADAQHFVAELVARMNVERQAFPAISLTSDPSVVTAIANDYGYEALFSRQVEALGQPGDVLLAISTSGRSKNVLRAIEVAQARQMIVIGVMGGGGDPLLESMDHCIRVPTQETTQIQEIHMAVLHSLCASVEAKCNGTPVKRG